MDESKRRRRQGVAKKRAAAMTRLDRVLKPLAPICIAITVLYTICSQGATILALFGVILAFMYARSNLTEERTSYVTTVTCQGGLLIWCIWSVVIERDVLLLALAVASVAALIWVAVRHDLPAVSGLTVLNVVAAGLLIGYIQSQRYSPEDDFHAVVMEFILFAMSTASAWLAWRVNEIRIQRR